MFLFQIVDNAPKPTAKLLSQEPVRAIEEVISGLNTKSLSYEDAFRQIYMAFTRQTLGKKEKDTEAIRLLFNAGMILVFALNTKKPADDIAGRLTEQIKPYQTDQEIISKDDETKPHFFKDKTTINLEQLMENIRNIRAREDFKPPVLGQQLSDDIPQRNIDVDYNVLESKKIPTGKDAALDIAKGPDNKTASNTEDIAISVHVPLYHAHHYKPIGNTGRAAELIQLMLKGELTEQDAKNNAEVEIIRSIISLGASFSELASRYGYGDASEKSLVEFLKSNNGRHFWSGLVQSAEDGTFVIVTSATCEDLDNPQDAIDQLEKVSVGRSGLTILFLNTLATQTNEEIKNEPDFEHKFLKEIDETSISVVPAVVLLVDPDNTDELIERAIECYKQSGDRTPEQIDFVNQKLTEFYSSETIAQNQHRFISKIKTLSDQGSSEAQKIWKQWDGKYVSQDKNGIYSFNPNKISKINTQISFNARTKQAEQTFEKALYVCATSYPLGGKFSDARFSAYSIISNVSLNLNIEKIEPVEKNKTKITVSVQKQFKKKDGSFENKQFIGALENYLVDSNGNLIEGTIEKREDKTKGKTFIDIVYKGLSPGQEYNFVANAFDEINSGWVKGQVQEKVQYYGVPYAKGEELTIRKGSAAYNDARIRVFGTIYDSPDMKNEINKVPLDLFVAFAGRDASGNIVSFLTPGTKKEDGIKVKQNTAIYKFHDIEVGIDRDLVIGNKVYKKAQLEKWAKEGKVALLVEDADSKRWILFDGRDAQRPREKKKEVYDQTTSGSENFLVSKTKGKNYRVGSVLSLNKKDNTMRDRSKLEENIIHNLGMPNYMVISEKEIKKGYWKGYTPEDLAKMHITHYIVRDKVYSLDGRLVGDLKSIAEIAETPADEWTDETASNQRRRALLNYPGLFYYFSKEEQDERREKDDKEFESRLPLYVSEEIDEVDIVAMTREVGGRFNAKPSDLGIRK